MKSSGTGSWPCVGRQAVDDITLTTELGRFSIGNSNENKSVGKIIAVVLTEPSQDWSLLSLSTG